jgi:parallel beta-helix repeat protein
VLILVRCNVARINAAGVLTILLGVVAAVFFALNLASEATAATTCSDSLQAKIDATPAGGTVRVDACIYREQLHITKPITLVGQPGSQIRGSDVWGAWNELANGNFRSIHSLPRFPQEDVSCKQNTKRCAWPEQVFVNGMAQRQVGPASDPRPGEFKVDVRRRVILGSDPEGKVIEVTVRRHWITGSASADGVTVRGFTMKHAANEWRSGAIQSREPTTRRTSGYAWSRSKPDGSNWNIENNILSDAHGAVLSVRTDEADILDNEISHGGQLGIHNPGDHSLIRGNYIHDNNTENFCTAVERCAGYSTDGNSRVSATLVEAGGVKIAGGQDFVTVSSNEISENHGNGLWFDVGTHDVTVSSNRIHHNARRGVFFEISDGAQIFSNTIYENGWASTNQVNGSGIMVGNSSNAEVYNNTLAWNAAGIAVLSADRSGTKYDLVHDVHVHDNTVLGTNSANKLENQLALVWLGLPSSTLLDPANNNRGANNEYWYTSPEGSLERFRWGKKSISKLAAFNATPGEENGRYLTQDEKDNLVANRKIPAEPERRQ